MTLRLSPEDQAEYNRLWALADHQQKMCEGIGSASSAIGAKKARQQKTWLHQHFAAKQLPPDPPTDWELEEAMTVEQRITRIEMTLGLGKYKP